MSKIHEQNRTVIVDVVRGLLLSVNGITGAETLKGTKGLRDCYGAVEGHLNYTPGKLPDDVKTVVRFEFDKLVETFTKSDDNWQLMAVRQRYGAKDGAAFMRRNASWRNENVPVTAYPQVIAQLRDDIKRLDKSLAEANAVGNKDGAAKIAGRIRQARNNIAILEADFNQFTKAQDERKTAMAVALEQAAAPVEVVA